MGCWNKTCVLTNLAILSGEKAYVFLIKENRSKYNVDRCYSSALWKPMLVPFVTTYNDYGGGENSDEFLAPILSILTEHIIEIGPGSNSSHDMPVKKEKGFLTEETFFNLIHENRLYAQTYPPAPKIEDSSYDNPKFMELREKGILFDVAFIRKDIVDRYLVEMLSDVWIKQGDRIVKKETTYKEMVDKIPGFIGHLYKTLSDDKLKYLPLEWTMNNYPHDAASKSLCDYLKFGALSDNDVLFPGVIINYLVDKRNTEVLAKWLERMLLGSIVDSLFSIIRKVWVPGCHEGSQSDSYMTSAKIAKYIIDHAEKRKLEFGSEED